MTWFEVTVEHEATGIKGKHYVQAIYPSGAEEKAGGPGLLVLEVRERGPEKRFINLPGYKNKD